MEVQAWIQMGCERREVRFDVSEAEIEAQGENLERYIEETVLDWIGFRFGWGWSCELIQNDFSFLEDEPSANLVVVTEVLNPRTERLRVVPRVDRQSISDRIH